MLQEVIRASIESKLNANTVSYADSSSTSILFVLGQYFQDDDGKRTFIYNITNGFREVAASYVPCTMEFRADYQALAEQITGSATCTLTFFVAVGDADQNNRIEALNQVVSLIVGNFEDIVDGSTTYHTVWNMNAITPPQSVETFNGIKYITMRTDVYIEFSDTNHYGNEYTIELDEAEINFLSFKSERGCEDDTPQPLGTSEQKGGVMTNLRTWTLTAFVDDTMSGILDAWEDDFDQDEVHDITITSPTMTTAVSLDVQVQSYVYIPEKGEKTKVTIVFFPSDGSYST